MVPEPLFKKLMFKHILKTWTIINKVHELGGKRAELHVDTSVELPSFLVPFGSLFCFQPTNILYGSVSSLSSARFPAAAGGCFVPTSSDKPAVRYLHSTKMQTM